MIYTSYFGNTKAILDAFPDAGLISIAGKTPDNLECAKYKLLMPKYVWWKEWHDKFADDLDSKDSIEWYTKQYAKTVLNALDPLPTARALKDLVDWKPTFILCYETPDKFCHRHIVAKWLRQYNVECKEWKTI